MRPDLVRPELSAEAIRLTRLLTAFMPGEPEIACLLALMLLQDSRRTTRTDDSGAPVPLAEQDRDQWNRAAIEEGLRILASIPGREQAGPYRIQAQIAACHARAAQLKDTNWATITRLYGELAALAPSPVVQLNRAVAVGMAFQPLSGGFAGPGRVGLMPPGRRTGRPGGLSDRAARLCRSHPIGRASGEAILTGWTSQTWTPIRCGS